MSFAGHVLDMINRDRYNREIRKSYRRRHARIREAWRNEYSKIRFRDKVLPLHERERIRAQIRKTLIHERRMAFFKTLGLTLIVSLVFVYFIWHYLFN